MIELSGKVEIRVLDAETHEVLEVIEQSNVITTFMYYNWTNASPTLMNNVYISTDNYPNYEDWPDVRNCYTNGYVPIGVTSPLLVPAAGPTPDYVQLMRRFDPPATTRTINTVLLANNTIGTSWFSAQSAYAYVNLNVPCVQTTTQLLDVFYRIQTATPVYTPYNYYNIDPIGTLTALVREDANQPTYVLPTPAGIVPIYSHVQSSSNLVPTDSQALFADFAGGGSLSSSGATIATSVVPEYGQRTLSWSYGQNNGIGDILAAWSIGVGGLSGLASRSAFRPAQTTINVTAPNNSPVQPVFSHAASTLTITSTSPFLDSFPSLGTGTVNFGGTWIGENFPELYKVEIVTGGAVGVATYKFSKRTHFGFVGASYVIKGSSLPGIYNIARTTPAISIVKPHTSIAIPSYTAGSYGNRLEKYDATKLMMHDSTGVTRYNCVTHVLETWDNISTPPLAATNIRQAAVNPLDNSIWVACANTGMYRISADGLTITNYTTANGLPSNSCYAVDIGRANAIWAICDGGVTTSLDNGTTWTTYNSGTIPAFNSPVLNADWSSVHYMRVDPTHPDDRMLFVRYADTPLNASIGGVWWDRGTGTAANAGTIQTDIRRTPNRMNVSDNDGIWIGWSSQVGNAYRFTYGSSASPVAFATSTLTPIFVRDSANTADVTMLFGSLITSGSTATLMASSIGAMFPHATRLYDSTNTNILTATVSGVPMTSINMVLNTYSEMVYMGNGVIAGVALESSGPGYCGAITALTGDATPTGGNMEYLIWEKYGWDGTNWVLNHAGAKPTHVDDQVMLHGITTRFADGATGTSFIANDYYTGSVNDGILKNNAMTMTGSHTHYLFPTQPLSSFDGVVRLYPWTTGAVTWRKVPASLTINVDNSLTANIPYRTHGMSTCSKNRVFGDFSISGTFSVNADQSYTIGISTDYVADTPRTSDSHFSTWGFDVLGNSVYVQNSVGGHPSAVTTITGTPTWNITRVGSTITFYINGVSKYSTTDTSYSFVIKARFTDKTTGLTPFTVNPVVVNSSGSGYYTGMGDSIAGSGIYNNKQLVATISTATDISISAVPLTTLNATPAIAPIAGAASIAREEGLLFLNAADAGSAITGNYFMSYQNTTPCNTPPV